MKRIIFLMPAFFLCMTTGFAKDFPWKEKTEQALYIHRAIKEVTDVMVHDIYSPPVASRTYAYISIAGYEALTQGNPLYYSLAGQLHGLCPIPKPIHEKSYSATLAAVQAILSVGKAMTISEDKIEAFRKVILKEFNASGIPADIFQYSVDYGQQIAAHILKWSADDNYKQSRSFPKYAVGDDAGSWKPTPPSYMKAVEPHWNKIRTFLIDSAQQFKPLPALPFSMDSGSAFYKEAMAVRQAGIQLTAEQKDIASFWDCNPFKMNISGHVMYATKKISPGGHWINITREACQTRNLDAVETAEAYAYMSITMADCFISCWDEKYRSRVIRPETYINQYIDNNWMPFLQTPPFPEYTSGHSVVSMAAAVVLASMFGTEYSYIDSTESEFGLPPRSFHSFREAAMEAAISRFYGGIQYMPSILNGISEGEEIGNYFVRKLRTRVSGKWSMASSQK